MTDVFATARRVWRLAVFGAVAVVAGGLPGAFLGGTAHAQEVGPSISSVSVSSTPANAQSYLSGETIRFAVNFASVVEVEGSPTLAVDVGGTEREAAFESVSGSEVLFSYVVTDDDFDSDGVSVGADKLSLGSGAAIADSGGSAASLTHVAVAGGAAHRVNMSVVTIAADSEEPVPENETAGFTLSRTGNLSRELTVSLQSHLQRDYVYSFQVPDSAVFPAGQATVQVEVPLRNDADVEPYNAALTMAVAQDQGYLIGSPSSAVAILTDDGDVLIGIVRTTGGSMIEGWQPGVGAGLTLRTTAPRDRPPDRLIFSVATRNIDTTSTRDPIARPADIQSIARDVVVKPEDWYSEIGRDAFAVPFLRWTHSLRYLVTVYDDLEPEAPEQFRLEIQRSAASGSRVFTGTFPYRSVFTIVDNEGSFDVSVDQPREVDIVEGDVLELEFTAVSRFRFSPRSSTAIEVDLEFEDDTAAHIDDYVQLDRTTSTTETVEMTGFATVGQRHQATSTVRISAVDNDDVEPVRQFRVHFGKTPIAPGDPGYDAGACSGDPPPDTPTCYGQNHFLEFFPADLNSHVGLSGYSMIVRIHDDDATPVAVTANASNIDEGENAVFTVTRTPSAADLPDPLTVSFDISETADFIDYSNDFELPTSVTIAGGATTATITVPTVDDNIGDGPGEIVATLRPGTADPGSRYAYTLTGRSASVAVQEDEPVMSVADVSVSEGAGTADVDVTLSGTSADAIGFTWATASLPGDADATAGQDYQSAGGNVEIPAGQTSTTLTVTITDDALDEPDDETFDVVLSAVTGASVEHPRATVTIKDNDNPPEFSISDATATEGPGASLDLTVSLNAESGRQTTVQWSAVSNADDDDPASEDVDYQAINNATLTIPAGDTAATITVQLLDDGNHEPTETFEVRLADPHNSVIRDGTGEAEILDDDTPTISIDDLSVLESAETAAATIRLDRPAYDEVTVRYDTAANTATAAQDYTDQSQVEVTIAAGLTTATAEVPILQGDVYEDEESFFVDLSNPVGAELGSDTRAEITIVDDDSPPTLSVRDAAAVDEESGPLSFVVERTGETSLPATFSWSTEDGTAEAGSDFTAAGGTVTIPATSSTAALQVQLLSDSLAENDETLSVTLSDPVGAAIADGSATGVILDNDHTAARTPGVVVTPSAVTVPEGGNSTYTVELSSQPAADATVAIGGHSGTDLTLSGTGLNADGELTFTTANWSTAQTVTVSAREDDDAVDDAAVTLTHTATSGSHTSAPVAVTVTITENDTEEVRVDPASLSVAEKGSGTYTVALATEPTADAAVTVTGHAGSDLTLSATVLTFTPVNWGTAQTVTVTASADADGANDVVTLTHTASGGGYGAAAVATVDITISDDDQPAIVVKPSALTMAEGGDSSYTVELGIQPTGDVTVTVTAPAGDLTILSPGSETLRFTPSNWNLPQTVTLAAGHDIDTTDDMVAVTHTAAGGGYGGTTAELPVTVTDTGSTAETLVVPASLSVREGDTDSYAVSLGSQPSGDVTVTVSGHSGTDLTLTGLNADNELTFTTENWNLPQTVTLAAGQDGDTDNDSMTLTNTAGGGGYDTAAAAEVAVTIVDNDAAGLVVTPTKLRVTEGDDTGASYQISLASIPPGTVGVTITANSTSVDADTGVVWFARRDWNAPRTITVTASDDPDLADATARLNHGVTFGTYAASAVRVDVTVEDDDVPGLAVIPSMLSVIEGASADYDVALTAQPSADVTVAIAGHAGSDLTLSGDSLTDGGLTFTADNWNQAQSVTASLGQDNDTTDDAAVTLTHTASGGGYDAMAPVGLPLTLTDDDRPRIVVPPAVSVTEGASATYQVSLAVQPSANVTVTIGGHPGSDVTVNNSAAAVSLMFTTSDWSTAQSVTVAAGSDDDSANDTVLLTHTAAGGDYADVTAQTTVTVVDDDEPEIVVSHSEVTVDEADPDGAAYSARLATEPSQQVRVEISSAQGSDLTLDHEILVFETSDWDEFQSVTVTAPSDADHLHEETQLAHVASGGEYDGTVKTVTVFVQDDDIPPGVTIDPTELTVVEGDATGVNYTVVLTSEPAGDVTVTVSGHSGTDLTLTGPNADGELTFTTANWGTAQTVTVKAAEDDDGVTDADVTLDHAISSTDDTDYDALANQSVTVSITENDVVGVTIDPTELTVAEGDATGVNYTVVLTSEPAGDVTVTVSGHSGTDLTLTGPNADGELTFTTANWGTAQTVTVKAAEDDDGVTDADVTLDHAISSTDDTDYDALANQSVTVSITENDVVGVTIDPTELTVAEGDATGVNYTVVLTSEPAGDVTVTVSGHSGTDLTLTGPNADGELTFTTANWGTAQTVTVKAAEDDDGVTDADVTLDHAISSTDDTDYDALANQSVTVSITENDVVGVTIDPTELTVAEGDATGVNYTVVLTSEPAGDVKVTVSGHSGTDLTLTGPNADGELTFTTANWGTAQTVTVKAAEDDDGVTDADVTLDHAISSTDDTDYDALANQSVTVSITENDVVGVTIDPTELTVAEGDATGVNYTVVLTSEPAGDVTVTVSGHSGTDLTLTGPNADGELTFTTANWGTAQTVTVKAAEDDDGVTDADVTLDHAISSTDDTDYDALANQSVTVSITENDVVGVTIDPTELTVAEGDATGVNYTVVLTSEPAGDVTVTVSGHSGTDLTLTGPNADGELTFTTANWGTAQTVTVKAAEDDDGVTDADVTLDHAISSTDDTDYDALANQSVTVSITENDVVGVTIDPTELTVAEGDATGVNYTVVLTSEPAGDVKVTVSGHSGTDLTLTGPNADGELTFTTANWGTAQTVTVKAAEDDDGVTDADVTLDHAISSTDDTDYDALANQSVTVSITENDVVGVTIDPTELTVAEGDATGVNYTVVLTSEPAGDVKVTVSGHSGTDLTLTGPNADGELTFTTANWGTAQTVTVKAAEDDDGVTDADVTLDHAISSTDDTDYDALANQSVTVSITENDVVGVTIDPTELTVAEGDATGVNYTVVLTSEPAGDVTVTVSGHSGTDLTLTGPNADGELTFTTANWGTAQTVTVKAAEDDDGVTDADVTLDHAISSTDDTDYDALANQSVTVSITENDVVGVTIDPTELTVAEGDATGVNYTVVLTSEPAGDVKVTVSGHSGTDLTLTGPNADGELTFTTANWGTAQTVTVKAAEDDDGVTDADVTLDHAISSTDDTDYDALANQSVTVSITENDVVGVTIDPTELTVAEGDATGVNYTVVLTSEPAGDVKVTVSGHSGTDLTLTGPNADGELTFTTANWGTAQTVTVKAAEDDDGVTDADVTLDHAISSTDDTDYDALANQSVTVSITENDVVGVTIDPTELTVAEGDATGVNYTVVLTSEPAGDVTVTVSGHSGTDLTLTGPNADGELTFTTANWGTAQTVTVKAAEDDDGVTDADVTLDHAISSTDDTDYDALANQSVTVSITENDVVGVTIDPTELTVAEGDATGVNYTVVLTSEPAGDVTVTVSGHSGTDLTLTGPNADGELTFTTANWGTAQTVTVKAAEDDDGVTDADVTLDHAISSTDDTDYDALANQSVTVSITENDVVGVTIDPTELTVAEGDATGVNYTVVLTSEPAGDVTVTVSGHSGTDLTLTGPNADGELTFTTANWGTAQTVTVKAAEDDDGVTDADVTLDHAISSTDDTDYDALANQSVTVSITENDVVGVTIDPTELTVAEGDATGVNYTVVLTSEPAGDVKVTVSGHSGTDLTLTGPNADGELTFTTANWGTAQTVTVKAAEDDDGVTDADVTLDHAISSTDDTDYDALANQSVTVSITENDVVGVTIDPTELTVVEGDATGVNYTVVLTSEPAGDVKVTVSGHSGTDLTLTGPNADGELTFTTANWGTAQTVTVKAAEDDDGVTDADVTLDHAISSTDDTDYDALANQSVTVSITENDVVGVTIDPTELTVAEGDATGVNYTVVLTSEPAGDVTVTVSGHSGTDLTLTGPNADGELTFTTANWGTAQTVTVKAAEDDDGVTDADVTLDHAISSTDDTDYDALANQSVTVSITENDVVGVTIDPTELTVAEGDATGVNYTVVLTSEPAGDVKVTVSGHSGTDLTLTGPNADGELTFTTANWGTAQTVTVKAAEDDDGVTDADVTLDHAISSTDDTDYDALANQSVTVSITENDVVGVTIDPTELTVAEGDATGVNYTVVLTSEPAGDVTVTVSGHSGTDLTLTGPNADGELTFTTANWGTAQTVTVKAAEDDDGVTDADVTLDHAISSTDDTDYDALANQSVTVSITENDVVGVTIDPTELTVAEGDATGVNYTVVLTSEPAGDVKVTVSGHSGTDLTLTGPNADGELTFTTANWGTAQTVTVKAAEDDDGVTDADVTLDHAISSTDDTDYDALANQSVTVSITENDVVGVTIDPTELTVAEGDATGVNYTVVLTSEPAGDVKVTVSGHSGTDLTLTGPNADGELTFTTANWGTAQTVTVKAAEDDDGVTDADVTLDHAISSTDDTDYDALANQSVTVSITENDVVGVTIDPTELTVAEGDATGVNYTVVLTSEPAGDVTVTVSGHSGTDLTLTGPNADGELTFTTANWGTAQTVTVKAAEDDDGVTDADVTLDHAISSTDDTDYDALANQSVTVSITENDVVGVTIDPTELTVVEGDATGVNYTVVLTSEPAGDVTVTVSGHSGTDLTLTGPNADGELTFTTANWGTAQTVTVKAAEDDDGVTDADVTLDHAISSTDDTDYDALANQSVTVSITENDVVGVTVAFEKEIHYTNEGASGVAGVEVLLSAPLQTEVIIPITVLSQSTAGPEDYLVDDIAGLTSDPGLTFSPGETFGYVFIEAVLDRVDEETETVVLGFGILPEGVSEGSPSQSTVMIDDDTDLSLAGSLKARRGDGEVHLEWVPAAAVPGDPDRAYQLRYGPEAGEFNQWRDIPRSAPGGSNERSYTVTGLENGTRYAFELRARRGSGFGTAAEIGQTPEAARWSVSTNRRSVHEGEDVTLSIATSNAVGFYSAPEPLTLAVIGQIELGFASIKGADPEDYEIRVGGTNVGGYTKDITFLNFNSDPGRYPFPAQHFNVEVPVGSTSLDVTVKVLADDDEEEGQEHMTFMVFRGDSLVNEDTWDVTGVNIESGDSGVVKQLAVADAEATEGEDPSLDFVVTLAPAADWTVTVDYATHDGTARAGADYTDTSGTLTFASGETEKTVSVPVIDDTVEDTPETLTLRLSNADPEYTGEGDGVWGSREAGVLIADGEATGTIRNTEDEAATPPDTLTASFPESRYASASHTGGDDRPQVVVAFSEAVASFGKDTPSVLVTGGTIHSFQAHTEDGLSNAWIFFLSPEGDSDVTFTLAAGVACDNGGICTASGTTLTDVPAELTIPGPDAVVERRPVAATLSVGDGAAEAGRFRLRIAFADAVSGLGVENLTAARVGGDGAVVSDLAETETGRVWTAWVAAADAGRYTVRLAPDAASSGERLSLAAVLAVDVDAAGNATAVAGPVVTSIALAMAPDGGLTAGNKVRMTFAFSEAVTVVTDGGTPTVGITLDGTARRAAYAGGTGTASLAFSYTLTADDGTVSAVSVTADSLALNGGTIRDAGGRDADLAHPGVGETAEDAETESASALTGLVLVDTGSGAEAALADRDALVLEDPSNGSYGLAASVAADADVGSVRLALTGAKTVTVTDNAAPYSLYGDENGTVTGAGLPAGSYTLTATAFAEPDGGGAELGTLEMSFTVAASEPVDPDAFTASFTGMPAEHGGGGESNRFTFELAFSENPELSYITLRDRSFTVGGGDVKKAKRKTQGSNQHWTITVEPDGWGDVSLILPGGRTCGTTGAVCTEDGKVLANTAVASVRGPLALSVADAQVREGPNALLAFEVTLNRAASETVTVDYATSDGTATAGADYTATSDTLTFQSGETQKTVNVAVLDDVHDDDGETLTLTLSNAVGARIRDAEATGTIENSDPLPKAWLARFGRTVANHVLEAVRGRMSSAPGPSRRVTLGGADMRKSPDLQVTEPSPWDELIPEDRRPENLRSLRVREFLLSSSFEVPLARNPGPGWTAWGGAARTSFSGRDSEVSIDGDVTTATLGVDRAWDRLITGVALARSTGDGSYNAGEMRGDLKSSITSAHPYLRFSLNDRLSAWTLLGYGKGELTLTHGGGGEKTDIEMKMAALGARGALIAAAGFDISARTDALLVRTSSEGTSRMAETEADVSRLRLVLEGSRPLAFASGSSLTPSVEVGVRRDGGDAERGVGFEVGGAMRYVNPSLGLTVEITARRLMAHERSGYSEWGAGGSLEFAPGGAERGFSAKLGSSVGTTASGVEGLWAMGDTRGLTGGAQAPGRLDAEAGYAMGAFGGSGVITPYGGFSMSGDKRYRAGWRLSLGDSFNLSLEGDRTENPDSPSSHGVALRGSLRW